MGNMWTDIEGSFNNYLSTHAGKLHELTVSGHFVDVLTKKDHYDGVKAVVFKCKNETKKTLHNVVFAVNPKTGRFDAWCGDSSIVGKDGQPEGRCNFWRDKAKAGDYVCKHIVKVYEGYKAIADRELAGSLEVSFNGQELAEKVLPLWKNTFIYGPTGSGKTHGVREMLKIADARVFRINVTDGYEDVDALQKLVPSSDGRGWVRFEGELVLAFKAAREERVIVSLEELTRSSRSFRNLLIKAMDKEDGNYMLHDITTGESICAPADNLMFVATGNINHADTSELDPALARRFPICLFQDYDPSVELGVLAKLTNKATAAKLSDIAKKIRNQYRAGRLPCPLDSGSLYECAEVMAAGLSLKEAAKMTWLFRVVEKDNNGYPEQGQIEAIMEFLS